MLLLLKDVQNMQEDGVYWVERFFMPRVDMLRVIREAVRHHLVELLERVRLQPAVILRDLQPQLRVRRLQGRGAARKEVADDHLGGEAREQRPGGVLRAEIQGLHEDQPAEHVALRVRLPQRRGLAQVLHRELQLRKVAREAHPAGVGERAEEGGVEEAGADGVADELLEVLLDEERARWAQDVEREMGLEEVLDRVLKSGEVFGFHLLMFHHYCC